MSDLHDDLVDLRDGVLVIANEMHQQAMRADATRATVDDWQDRLRGLLPSHMQDDWTFTG